MRARMNADGRITDIFYARKNYRKARYMKELNRRARFIRKYFPGRAAFIVIIGYA